MKEDLGKRPVLVIGGSAQDFLGEYMAGGVVILLGLGNTQHRGNFIGTGMHGGVIYIRGDVDDSQLSKDVGVFELEENDKDILTLYVTEFASYFDLGVNFVDISKEHFLKLLPTTKRPYGQVYAHRSSQ
jgi:glutamate synthase domain-containing protein 3